MLQSDNDPLRTTSAGNESPKRLRCTTTQEEKMERQLGS
jgi:hypothetical protein